MKKLTGMFCKLYSKILQSNFIFISEAENDVKFMIHIDLKF